MKGCSVLITKNEFAVLAALEREPGTSQRAIAARKAMSLGSVNAAYKALVDKGLVVDGALSDAGFEALAPFKVDNAIILAAGLSSRFAPISYEKPKGLLHVRGEILIERQIRQLQESGIDDITVVAGYKKEYFFYLEEKHGVSIVVNEEYATRNNHSSLMVVRERLGNTFICSSDNYFVENPFEPYVWKAYYAAQYQEGPTNEWCMRLGSGNRIVSVDIGAATLLSCSAMFTSIKTFLVPFPEYSRRSTICRRRPISCGKSCTSTISRSWTWLRASTPSERYSSSTHSTSCANSIRVSWKTSIPRLSTISLQRSGATKTIFATCIR